MANSAKPVPPRRPLIGERLSADTSLLGEPFSLSPGARNGESIVTALRLALEYIYRGRNQVIAARSRFSFGLDALGSTIHAEDDLPDSRYFAWLGQVQWVRRLGLSEVRPISDTEFILRSDLQIADDPLLTLEQIAVGGRYSVRGYRENTLVRDNAHLASLEVRIPILQNLPWADYLQLAPFVDYGRAWQSQGRTEEPRYLLSVGVGLRWALAFRGAVPVRPCIASLNWICTLPLRKCSRNPTSACGARASVVVGGVELRAMPYPPDSSTPPSAATTR